MNNGRDVNDREALEKRLAEAETERRRAVDRANAAEVENDRLSGRVQTATHDVEEEPEHDESAIAPEDQGPGFPTWKLIAALLFFAVLAVSLLFGVLHVRASQNEAPVVSETVPPVAAANTFAPIPQPPLTPVPTPTYAAPPKPTVVTPVPLPQSATTAPPTAAPRSAPDASGNRNVVPALTSGKMTIDAPPAAINPVEGNGIAGQPPMSQDQQAQATMAHTSFTPVYDNHGRLESVNATSGAANAADPSSGSNPSAHFVSSDVAAEAAANVNKSFVHGQGADAVGYVQKTSRYQLNPTTHIPLRLDSMVRSNQPGTVTAVVTANVYDSATHQACVIPRGTIAEGVYDSAFVANQDSLVMAWPLLLFPDGSEFSLGNQPGTDGLGVSGLSGTTDYHRGQLYGTAAFLTILGIAEGLLTPNTGSGGFTSGGTSSVSQQVGSAAGSQLANVGSRIVDQQVRRAPTVELKPPYPMMIDVTRDLPMEQYKPGCTPD